MTYKSPLLHFELLTKVMCHALFTLSSSEERKQFRTGLFGSSKSVLTSSEGNRLSAAYSFGSFGREDSISRHSLERPGSTSLDTSFDKDIQMRHHMATDHRGRMLSNIGSTMEYPSYLDSSPNYHEEMRYTANDTLSPKNADADKSRVDSVFSDSADYSTLGRDSLNFSRDPEGSADVFGDVDMKHVADDIMQKDYMEHAMTSQVMSQPLSLQPPTDSRHKGSPYSVSGSFTSFDPDNVPVDRSPVYSGFLISFMVDARGGAMRGCRHPCVRVIVPPRKCSMPTRVTCRLVKKEKLTKPPPMLEGEGLAARVLEMGPVGTKFLGPVLIEVPHYASLRGKEREVVILRSDNGENWYEHPMQATEEALAESLGSSAEELDSEEVCETKRIKRILTADLPMYFALVSRVTRVKQESTMIGNEGGVLSSNVVPQVQAVFPRGTLTRPISVGLQAQPIAPELVAKLLGNRVAVSPIVTVEPRCRRFHKPITLTIPLPRAAQKGMINNYTSERPTLRLLVNLAGDPSRDQWQDATETKPITLVDDCVSFTTSVSARFWLMDCQNVNEAVQMASVLYQEAVTVPYMAKFVVFAKRDSPQEGRLRVFCMTDDKDDKTLEKQEKFFEVARSRDIEVLEGRAQYVEMAGNLIPVTKSGDQLHVNFRAFRENRLPCTVKIRDQDQDPGARVAFMKEPKVTRGEAPQTPICNLNIKLPDMVGSDSSGEMDADKAAEFRKKHEFLRGQGLVIADTKSSMRLSDIADTVQGDWVVLAQQLEKVSMADINHIKSDYKTVGDQALAMLHLWVDKNGEKATSHELELALRRINREDVVRKCIHSSERVEDEVEEAAARATMDQSGFDTFNEEIGITKDSMNRGMSLDVQFDEQDMVKESESAEESPIRERAPTPPASLPPQQTESRLNDSMDDELFQATIDDRRPVAKAPKTSEEEGEESSRKKAAYLSLALQMDDLAESIDASKPKDESETSQQKVQGEKTETPPPSPTEQLDSEEPVLPSETESNIAAAVTRLASETEEAADSGRVTSVQEHEVMYSRAAFDTYETTSSNVIQSVRSESSSQLMSPASDSGSTFHEEPSPVPEPSLPEDFNEMDSSVDLSSQYVERSEQYLMEEEQKTTLKRGGSYSQIVTIEVRERITSTSMDSDTTFKSAQQSIELDDTLDSNYQYASGGNETLLADRSGPRSPKDEGSSAMGEDEEVETHRLMMKKEVHKKTMIGPDGKEQTTVMEDSQIQQENEPPEELRDSMQEIINQFMESDPQPAQLPAPTQSKEEEV